MIELIKFYLDTWSSERDMYNDQLQFAGQQAPIAAKLRGAYDALVEAIAFLVGLKEQLEDHKVTSRQATAMLNAYTQKLEVDLVYMSSKAAEMRDLRDRLNTLKNL